jgi:hypothetical protein
MQGIAALVGLTVFVFLFWIALVAAETLEAVTVGL